ITVRIYDNVNNNVSDTITCTEDDTAPVLTDAMSAYSEDSGNTDDVYGVIGTNTFYFSDSFPSSAIVTFTATGTDTGGANIRGIDFGAIPGGNNPAEDSSSPYTGTYTVENATTSGSITVTIYDNVGNSHSATITCTQDTTGPSISLAADDSSAESSQYLYSSYGDQTEGVYGSGMGSAQLYTISGTASDSDADLLSIVDDTTFGGDPTRGGTLNSWQFAYQVTSSDNGDISVTYTTTDNVGNSNTVTYIFYEDNSNPTLIDAMSYYTESGDIDEVYNETASNIFYFSNDFDSDASVTFTATGSDTGYANVRGIEFGIFGADSATEDQSSPYEGTYTINNADNSGSITVRIYDNVGNTVSGTITCTEDGTDPVLTDAMSAYSEDSGNTNDVYGVIGTNTFYYSDSFPSSAIVTFTATGTDTGGADIRGIDFGVIPGGNNPAEDSSSPYTGTYTVENATTSGAITVTIYDNVGNSHSSTITCTEDKDPPSSISLSNFYDTTDADNDGYTPFGGSYNNYEAFYDDPSFTADISFSDAIGNSSIQLGDGSSYGISTPSGIDVPWTLTSNTNNTIYWKVVDNVGNVNESYSSIDVYYTTNTPTNMYIDVTGTAIWTMASPSYAWISDPTHIDTGILFLGNVGNTNWGLTLDATGTWDGGGEWKVIFEAGWGVGSDIEDFSDPYSTGNVYSSNAGSQSSIKIDIVNRCGLNQTIILFTTADTTDPTMDSISVSGNDSSPLTNWDQDGKGFVIDFVGTADAVSNQISGWIVEFNDPTPDSVGGYFTPTDDYTYPEDIGDGSSNPYSFYAVPVDCVGNEGSAQSADGNIDETDPVLDTVSFISPDYVPNWYDQGSTSSATYQIAFTENNAYEISITCVIGGSDRASDAIYGSWGESTPFDSVISLSNTYSDGNYSITMTIRDKSGRTDTTVASGPTFILLDKTAPNVDINYNYQVEGTNGEYLYWDSSNQKWWYGNEMGANNADLTVGVDAEDIGSVASGLWYAISNVSFGGNDAARTDSGEGTNPTYDVPVVNINSTDDWTGDLLITVYDLVGNSNTTTIAIDRDITTPTGYTLSLDVDTASINYTPNTGYYDDNTVDVTCGGTII
ncbi:MAG: beta strand repeat-containing protein, partial [Candidatus Hodarchaeales archaeon]